MPILLAVEAEDLGHLQAGGDRHGAASGFGFDAEPIEWADYFAQGMLADMSVKHCGLEAFVPHQFLDIAQIRAMLEQMGGEAVAQHVRADLLGQSGPQSRIFDHLLNAPWITG